MKTNFFSDDFFKTIFFPFIELFVVKARPDLDPNLMLIQTNSTRLCEHNWAAARLLKHF
jgi:hypothetical protein